MRPYRVYPWERDSFVILYREGEQREQAQNRVCKAAYRRYLRRGDRWKTKQLLRGIKVWREQTHRG